MLVDKKLQSSTAYTTQPCNLTCKTGLKALAVKILQQTTQCNLNAKKSSDKLQDQQFTQEYLKNFLGEDWLLYKDNPKALMAWKDLLYEQQLMRQGQVPPDFTAKAYCESCQQQVYIPPAQASKVLFGCPWCLNKANGLPIPMAQENVNESQG